MIENHKHKEILLVDDDPDYCELTSTRLETAGYRVSRASNGREALKLLEGSWYPSLIIMDIDMPDSNGLTTLINLGVRQVRRNDNSGSSTPVVVATGLQGENVREMMASQNVNGYLKKPFSSEELLSTVKRLIG